METTQRYISNIIYIYSGIIIELKLYINVLSLLKMSRLKRMGEIRLDLIYTSHVLISYLIINYYNDIYMVLLFSDFFQL